MVPRSVPTGHHRLGDGLFGIRFRVQLEALTPLLVRTGERDALTFPRRGGWPALPGSSLKGAVRSLHEALTGSCLRVFDGGFVPVYRDQARPRPAGWHPVVVRAVDEAGRPTAVEPCSTHAWAEAPIVHAVVSAGQLRTGSLVEVDEARIVDGDHQRREVLEGGLRPGQSWVVVVSDAKARRRGHPYSCAVGRLSGALAEVPAETWTRYREAVEGSDDVRLADAQRHVETRVNDPGGIPIGARQAASRQCQEGEVFWGRVDAGRVTDLALSVIWRSKGEHPAEKRVPPATLPCTSAASLCPSCRIFGSAGDDDQRQAAEQHSYRGHVRIGDAVADGDVVVERRRLPPMGAPGPGAGQLYLRPDPDGPKRAGGRQERPIREWGSAADQPSVRQLAGRKYYWHADPEVQHQARGRRRDVVRPHQHDNELAAEAEVVEAGTFKVVVVAEGLDEAQLGSLVAAFEPHRALADHVPEGWRPGDGDSRAGLAIRLGGGKPLGLGSVRATVTDVQVWTACSRYDAAPEPSVTESTIDGWVAAFVAQVPQEVKATWRHLAAALRVGHVNPASVWYPPAGNWNVPDEQFEAGGTKFPDFWTNSAGSQGAGHDVLPLPEAEAIDQYLPIRGF
ncbi:MAG: TIGR03986 family CRISPR-associated RAMP protein [Acidimicrobiales bacterium]